MGKKHCHCKNEKSTGCKSKGIDQCDLNKHHGNLVLCEPGNYHLKSDVFGTIHVKSSNVCLDLCCHTLNANGSKNAIVIAPEMESVEPSSVSVQDLSVENKQKVNKYFDLLKKNEMADFHPKFKHLRPDKKEFEELQSGVTSFLLGDSPKSFGLSDPAATTLHRVSVINGTVMGASEDGIVATLVTDLQLTRLTMLKHMKDFVSVSESYGIKIDHLVLDGSLGGLRAFNLVSNKGFHVSNINSTRFVLKDVAAVRIEQCESGTLENTDLLENSSETTVLNFSEPGSIVYVRDSSNITLTKVRANSNKFNSVGDDSGLNGNFNIVSCISCYINDCNANNNVDESTSDLTYFVGLWATFSRVTVKGFKWNNNRASESFKDRGAGGVFIINSGKCLIEDVQVIDNIAPNMNFFNYHGIRAANFFAGTEGSQNTFRRCVIKGNQCLNSDSGLLSYLGLRINNVDCVIEDSEASDNIVFTEGALFNNGFVCSGPTGSLLISNCVATGNICPDAKFSLAFPNDMPTSGFNLHSGNVTVLDCVGNRNGESGLLIYGGINVTCNRCTFSQNGNNYEVRNGAGVANGGFNAGGAGRITLRDCTIEQNGTEADNGYGIRSAPGFPDHYLTIDNCDINRNTGKLICSGLDVSESAGLIVKDSRFRFQENRENAILFTAVTLDKLSGYGPADSPYLEKTIPVTMKGDQTVTVEFSKDSTWYGGEDSAYFFLKNLVITNPAEGPIEFPLSTAPLGVMPDDSFFEVSGLRFTVYSNSPAVPWTVKDIDGDRVIQCGEEEVWQNDGPGGSVTAFDNNITGIRITTVDGDANREYSFDVEARYSTETNYDFLTVYLSGIISPTGISVLNSSCTVIENTIIEQTRGANPGIGLLMQNSNNFSISNTTSLCNTGQGYQLVNSSNGVVQNSKALSNGATGFSDNQADVTLRNTYIGNVASKNGTNYDTGISTMIDNISV